MGRTHITLSAMALLAIVASNSRPNDAWGTPPIAPAPCVARPAPPGRSSIEQIADFHAGSPAVDATYHIGADYVCYVQLVNCQRGAFERDVITSALNPLAGGLSHLASEDQCSRQWERCMAAEAGRPKFTCHDFAYEYCRDAKTRGGMESQVFLFGDTGTPANHTETIVIKNGTSCLVNAQTRTFDPGLCWTGGHGSLVPITVLARYCGDSAQDACNHAREAVASAAINPQGAAMILGLATVTAQAAYKLIPCDANFYPTFSETPWWQTGPHAGSVDPMEELYRDPVARQCVRAQATCSQACEAMIAPAPGALTLTDLSGGPAPDLVRDTGDRDQRRVKLGRRAVEYQRCIEGCESDMRACVRRLAPPPRPPVLRIRPSRDD